jgi:hypothetical protein
MGSNDPLCHAKVWQQIGCLQAVPEARLKFLGYKGKAMPFLGD